MNAFLSSNGCDATSKYKNPSFVRSYRLATAVYGAVLGIWRSPLMAVYVAVKLPVVFVVSTLAVSAFGWMVGLVVGAEQKYREVLAAVFSAMVTAGGILLALVPVVLYFILTGALDEGSRATMRFAHACMMFGHIIVFPWLVSWGIACFTGIWRGVFRLPAI